MAKLTGFLDNLASGALSPKGNLGDFRHASKTFVNDAFRLAPKARFLYHVYFELNDEPASVLPGFKEKHKREIGLLVKNADLPSYSATVDTKKKYNRIKNVQTSITYNPINITFHDDNLGITTALIEGYYRYYFRDGSYASLPEAYSKNIKIDSKTGLVKKGDSTYEGYERNKFRFGLDNDSSDPFFKTIRISQLTRKTYTTYTLVNPMITDFGHDRVDSQDASGLMENKITVAYEAVWYDRGRVEEDTPLGFGNPSHYDTTPSPGSLLGGAALGLGGAISTGVALYDFVTGDGGFRSPLEAGLAAANLVQNVRGLSSEGLRQEGFSLLKGAIGAAGGTDVSGVSNIAFPKNGGNGGASDVVLATAAVAGVSAIAQAVDNSSAALDSAARIANNKEFQANGGTGGVNGNTENYNNLPPSERARLRSGV